MVSTFQNTLQSSTWFALRSPIRERVSDRSFVLSDRASYNSFQIVASGRCVPEPDGTRIEVDLGVSAFVVVLMLLWFCGVGVCALVGLLVFPASGGVSRGSFLLLPTGTLVFGIVLCILGRKKADSDTAFLLGFLRETPGAEETGDASS